MLEMLSIETLEAQYRPHRRAIMEAVHIRKEKPSPEASASEKMYADAIGVVAGLGKLHAIRRDVDQSVFNSARKVSGDDGAIVQILQIASPTSLNISKLPDGSIRATALTQGGGEWPEGKGLTPGAALKQLADKLKG